eukprot:scaffold6463_cov405-Prasinococcus_capsulatus_cf.AAC.2
MPTSRLQSRNCIWFVVHGINAQPNSRVGYRECLETSRESWASHPPPPPEFGLTCCRSRFAAEGAAPRRAANIHAAPPRAGSRRNRLGTRDPEKAREAGPSVDPAAGAGATRSATTAGLNPKGVPGGGLRSRHLAIEYI